MDGFMNSMIDKAADAAKDKATELLGGGEKKAAEAPAAEQGIGDKISGAIGDAVAGAAADKAADNTMDNVMSFGSKLFK